MRFPDTLIGNTLHAEYCFHFLLNRRRHSKLHLSHIQTPAVAVGASHLPTSPGSVCHRGNDPAKGPMGTHGDYRTCPVMSLSRKLQGESLSCQARETRRAGLYGHSLKVELWCFIQKSSDTGIEPSTYVTYFELYFYPFLSFFSFSFFPLLPLFGRFCGSIVC